MFRRFDPVAGRNAEIIETVMSCPEVAGLDEARRMKMRLCVEEVEENILSYSGTTWVDVHVCSDENSVSVSFEDGGVEFDPLKVDDPDLMAPVEDRQVGGLGIFLCKQIMDSVEYRFENKCNKFTMKMLRG